MAMGVVTFTSSANAQTPPPAPTHYRIIEIGPPPGLRVAYTIAYGISNRGEVVGIFHHTPGDGTGNKTRGFIWLPVARYGLAGQVTHDLAAIGGPSGPTELYAINSTGQTTGGACVDFSCHETSLKSAILFDLNTLQTTSLGFLENGEFSLGYDLTDEPDVTVVGGASKDPGTVYTPFPFRWSAATGMEGLDTYNGGRGHAYGINALDHSTGYVSWPIVDGSPCGVNIRGHAWPPFVTSFTLLSAIGADPGGEPAERTGFDINDLNFVVGQARDPSDWPASPCWARAGFWENVEQIMPPVRLPFVLDGQGNHVVDAVMQANAITNQAVDGRFVAVGRGTMEFSKGAVRGPRARAMFIRSQAGMRSAWLTSFAAGANSTRPMTSTTTAGSWAVARWGAARAASCSCPAPTAPATSPAHRRSSTCRTCSRCWRRGARVPSRAAAPPT